MRVILDIPDEIAEHLESSGGRRTLRSLSGCQERDAYFYYRAYRDRITQQNILTPHDIEERDALARMVSMSTKPMPSKYRKVLASILMETEKAMASLPRVTIEDNGKNEAAVLLLSDWHGGKRVYNESGCIYNKDICAHKISLLKSKVIHLLTNHQRIENYDLFVIALLGDIVDGSGIYPFQELNQDLTSFHDQVGLMVAGIWDIARAVNSLGLPVMIKGVRGNHGRQGKDAHPDNNFDIMVYMLLRFLAYQHGHGISVDYAKTTAYMNFEAKGHRIHLRHEAPPQAETPAARAKFAGWRGMHNYDIICYAHLHHPSVSTFLDSYAIMNGWPVGPDDLSESIAKYSRPSQTLFGISPSVGKTFHYDIYLDSLGSGKDYDRLMERYPQLER